MPRSRRRVVHREYQLDTSALGDEAEPLLVSHCARSGQELEMFRVPGGLSSHVHVIAGAQYRFASGQDEGFSEIGSGRKSDRACGIDRPWRAIQSSCR